jgi:hypothetical protein
MTGFAGSRSLDERRRRRLATDSDTVALEAVAEPVPRRVATQRPKQSRRGPAHFPLRKVISIRYWKLALAILCAVAAGAGILFGGWATTIYGERLGPGFVLLFRLDVARLVRGFATVGFLLVGELALLIGWARSQSLQDFNGRYRGWLLCAVLAFVAAFGLETQLAAALSATVGWLWSEPFWHKETLCWLVPAAACGLFAHAYAVREMRDCRLSLSFAWLAALLASGTAALVLARPLALPEPQSRLLECGIALGFVVCLFASLTFHTRHVVYVCVDPPAIRPSRLLSLLRALRPGAIFRFKRNGSKKTRRSSEAAGVTSLKRRTRKRPPRRKPELPETEVAVEDVKSPPRSTERAPAADPVESHPARAAVNRRANVPAVPFESAKKGAAASAAPESGDAEDSSSAGGSFQGLSRKEWRLLKKQIRSEQAPLRRSA